MMLTFYQLVGQRIQEELDRQGVKQQFLADALGISKQVMSKILRGEKNTTIYEMNRIADILGVTVDCLSRPTEQEVNLYEDDEQVEPSFMGRVKTKEGREGVLRALKMIGLIQEQERARDRETQYNYHRMRTRTVDFSDVNRWEGDM